MISEQPTRKIVKELKAAGWSPLRSGTGSHTRWQCRSGAHLLTEPDGHKTISPGVVRNIRQAIAQCAC